MADLENDNGHVQLVERASGGEPGLTGADHHHGSAGPQWGAKTATAIFNRMMVESISDLDLSYTPPLGSPSDALQTGAQTWQRQAHAVPFTAA